MEDEEKEVEGIQEKINWFTTFLLSLIDIPEKMRKKGHTGFTTVPRYTYMSLEGDHSFGVLSRFALHGL